MNYSAHISKTSQSRNPSGIRAMMPYLNNKELISLGAGQPNPTTFPFAGMTIKLKTGETVEVDDSLFTRALCYDASAGQSDLRGWLRKLQKIEHNPPGEFDLAIGSGSQDLLTKAFEMLIDSGNTIIVEKPTYTGALSFLHSMDCSLAEVDVDKFGLVPESLENILSNWPSDQRRPHVLYTVPSGGNPTGISVTFERKQKIYAICSQYDVIILEDDPYYFLQYGEKRIPSYLSIDVDGRVIRLDSMSKVLSSGIRIGWVTGPEPLIERINTHTMSTNLQPSGVAQAMTLSLLEKWGHERFFEHIEEIAGFYRKKRDEFLECLEHHMKGRAEWVVPDAGMFIWLRLLGGITDSYDLVMKKAIKEKVLAVPGSFFMPRKNANEYIRVSFSSVSKDEMNEALRRLAAVIDAEAKENRTKPKAKI